jgi:protein-L-isoaspartate(D-aspartate) O-methyltransferase
LAARNLDRHAARRRFSLIVLLLLLSACIDRNPGRRDNDVDDWTAQRDRMVRAHLVARDITDPRVLAAMGEVSRHEFVPPARRSLAYADHPLPIGNGQTISQPYVVALMTQLLALRGDENVLEIGTGSGYQAAVLSRLANTVYTIELEPELAASATERLRRLGYENVRVRAGDGFFGWPERAPFDAIMITAATPRVPERLVEQLRQGGRIVLPLDRNGVQELIVGTKHEGKLRLQSRGAVLFVPMLGEVREEE